MMQTGAQPNVWQTFFNLGGLAGALSLLWQIYGTLRERARKARLKVLDFVPNRDAFNFQWGQPGQPDDVRFVTLQVKNNGKRYARGCIARAVATALSPAGERREAALHWADTPIVYQTTGQPQIDIPPGGTWRLDVAFSLRSRNAVCLASNSALHGNYIADALLATGQHSVEVRVSFEDGDNAVYRLKLTSSPVWNELNAVPV